MEPNATNEDLILDLARLFSKHRWVAIAVIVIGLVIRLMKSEKAPAFIKRIHPNARPLIAMALGILSAMFQRVSEGVPWSVAIAGGLLSASFSVFGHQVVIEWLRGGKELFAHSPKPLPNEPKLVENKEERPSTDSGRTPIEGRVTLSPPKPKPTLKATLEGPETPREPRSKNQ